MHRLSWIDAQIRQRLFPNCDRIAERFSISQRQAARDVEYIKDTMSAPIEYCHKRKGYFYSCETFVLGNILVTDQQRQGLAYLAEQYAKLETEHARHLSRLFRRLIDNSTEAADIALPLFPIDPLELGIFDKIYKSIESGTKVEITYDNEQGSSQTIRISPYKLYSLNHENFIVGYCEPDKQIRFFALSGLLSAIVTNTKYDLTPLLKQAEIVPELANEANTAFIRLDADSYAGTFPFRFQAMGDKVYRVEYYDPNRLLAALFVSPIGATIESPKWLRNMYMNLLEKKFSRLLENDTICQSTFVKMDRKQAPGSELIPMR